MALQASLHKRVFNFSFNARTSRGAMKDKTSWFVTIWDTSNPAIQGIGECGPLPGLSNEHTPDLNEKLESFIVRFNTQKKDLKRSTELSEINNIIKESLGEEVRAFPSLVFAFETALLDLFHGGKRVVFNNSFITGKPIPINGLIWMGGLDFMLQQIEIKIKDGFRCIKLKVGGIDFEKECDVLQYIRRKYFRDDITIRLDANGAFKPSEALFKLNELAKYDIHSIEQPIKPNLPEMEEVCLKSPIPIALDEELIGIQSDEKESLIHKLKPAYLILKPSLHGGLLGCQEWIQLAEKHKVGWWITSALESNIGLNAIAQFTAEFNPQIPQGLGTGMIYSDNIESPLAVESGFLRYSDDFSWDEINFS